MTDVCPRPWSAQTEEDFLLKAGHYYKHKNPLWTMGLNKPEIVRWLYQLGRDLNLLKKDYIEFEAWVYGKRIRKLLGWEYRPRYKFEWCQTKRWGNHLHYPLAYRVLRKFTRMPWHRKKEKRDLSWWEFKQIVRDRRRRHRGCCNRWRRSLKRESKSRRRTQERAIIASENWEAFPKKAPRWRDADRWAHD